MHITAARLGFPQFKRKEQPESYSIAAQTNFRVGLDKESRSKRLLGGLRNEEGGETS